MAIISKNERIKNTLKETRLKRQTQRCNVLELKIDYSHLNAEAKEQLKMLFVEAKWFYNFILSQENPFQFDYKTINVMIKNKFGIFEERTLTVLPAKCRQVILQLLKQNIYSLSKLKKKGKNVGKLKFKSSYNSIDLNQYGITHRIIGKSRIRINGIKKPLKIRGLEQVREGYELANAKLLKKPSGYYIKLTCFEFIKPNQLENEGKTEIGLDFGIKNTITTSEGEVFNISVGETEHLKGLQRKFARQQKGSNNRYKTRLRIQKEYEKMTNRKKDAGNKLVSYLLTRYSRVHIQDENLKGWQSGFFGKQVQHSCLGLIKARLRRAENVVVVDRYFPTTKMCYQCGRMNDNITLADRIFECECGLKEDRDMKSAKTILYVGRCNTHYIPMEHRSTPVEQTPSTLISPYIRASRLR